ncbi:MAG: Asp-tRNA(Asn)/Glu-tRNA(Gln) amidotransferase subunit GatA [Verrucomicrobia bacterium]|nr:Asp-tRNA(Asn)/Glu-tRNA(Gln) amidotransferase subunit GatA [Verrucomicrobiota bacterium]
MAVDLHFKTLSELQALLSAGELSSVELTQALVDRKEAVDDKVQAFNSLDKEQAIAQAEAADQRRAAGSVLGPLDGIPIGLKDVISVKGQPLTCSSKMLENFVSPYDATATTHLKVAGAVLSGRLNMDEFAMGSSTENSAFKTTVNPWDLERVAGGSSGGSAAAVSAGAVPVSLGSDTGGSIRQPASFCGVVGFKPTYGRVSRFGLVAYASSLDQIGPFGRSVKDVATVLQTIAGHDPKDSTSIEQDVPDYAGAIESNKSPWKLGIPKEYFGEGLDPEVKASIQSAIDWYADQGCEIHEVTLPHMDLAVAVYYIIATAEASSNLARYDGVRYTHRSKDAENAIDLYFKSRAEGFGEEVKRRIILGTYVLSSGYYDAYYLRAQKVRTLIRLDFMKAYETVDALLTPTSPFVSFKAGEKNEDPLAMYLSDIYTISANLAGIPGISIPCGLNSEGLPVGLQIQGKPFGEADLLAIANAYEEAHDYSSQHPSL